MDIKKLNETIVKALNEDKEKINIHELIEGYNFSLVKTRVPEIEILKKARGNEVLFDAEDFEEEVGKPCYVLYDNMKYEIRNIFLGDKITPQMSMDVAENLDTFINDSIWEDVIDNFIPEEDKRQIHDFPELFEYLNTHENDVSEWEKTVVEILATGNANLFEEITDDKEQDFKKVFGIQESLKEDTSLLSNIEFFDDDPLYDGECYPKRLPYNEDYRYYLAPAFKDYRNSEDGKTVKATPDYEHSTGLIKIPYNEFEEGFAFAYDNSFEEPSDEETVEMYCLGNSIYFKEVVDEEKLLLNFTVLADVMDHHLEYDVTGEWIPPKNLNESLIVREELKHVDDAQKAKENGLTVKRISDERVEISKEGKSGQEVNDTLEEIGIQADKINPTNCILEKVDDLNEDEFSDRVDVNFDISLYEYGVVRNPENDMTLIGTKPTDEGVYSDYAVTYISLDDVKEVIADMEDGFFEFIDQPKEEILQILTNEHLAPYIQYVDAYNGYWNAQFNLREDKQDALNRLQQEYDKETEGLPNGSKEMYLANKKFNRLKKKVDKHFTEELGNLLTKEELIAKVKDGILPDEYEPSDIGQGYGYKLDMLWNEIPEGVVIYIPEYGYSDDEKHMPTEEGIYTKADFREITKDEKDPEKYAEELFYDVDWQFPESLYSEWVEVMDESINEKYCTKGDITKFLKAHKATEVAWGRFISEVRGTDKLFDMDAFGKKKIAGTYDNYSLSVYPKGASYREELATGWGNVTNKYYIFGKEVEGEE